MLKRPTDFPLAAAAEHKLDRRRFLHTAATAAVVTLCGEWAARGLENAHASPPRVRVLEKDHLPPGSARAATDVNDAGREALVVRLDETTVVAFDRRCPHLGCPVLWSAERGRFECPCHHAAFDARTGRVLFGPPRRGLTPAHLEVA